MDMFKRRTFMINGQPFGETDSLYQNLVVPFASRAPDYVVRPRGEDPNPKQ